MTLKELSQLYWLRREVRRDEERLEAIEAAIEGIPSPPITGMPRGSEVQSRTERLAVELADMQAVIRAKRAQCVQEQARLERYIAAIPDSLTRQVFTERFIEGKTWQEVADTVGGNTEKSVSMLCYRWLKGQ